MSFGRPSRDQLILFFRFFFVSHNHTAVIAILVCLNARGIVLWWCWWCAAKLLAVGMFWPLLQVELVGIEGARSRAWSASAPGKGRKLTVSKYVEWNQLELAENQKKKPSTKLCSGYAILRVFVV